MLTSDVVGCRFGGPETLADMKKLAWGRVLHLDRRDSKEDESLPGFRLGYRTIRGCRRRLLPSVWTLVAVSSGACSTSSPSPDPDSNEDLSEFVFEQIATIGGAAAVGPEAFGSTRAVALVGGTNQLAVLDGSVQRVHFFTVDGTYIRSLGRRGNGPGESKAMAGIAGTAQGGLCTWDPQRRRVTEFDSIGSIVRSHLADLNDARSIMPEFVGFRDDCSFVLKDAQQVRGAPATLTQDTIRFVLYSAEGTPLRTLAKRPDSPKWWHRTETSNIGIRPIFGTVLGSVATRGGLLIGSTDSLSWDNTGWTGLESRKISFPTVINPVIPADVQLERRRRIAEGPWWWVERLKIPGMEEVRVAGLQAVPAQAFAPSYDHLVMSTDGGFWFREALLPRDTVAHWVFASAQDKLEGGIRWPRDAELKAASRGVLVFATRDEFDAPVLKVLRRSRE
jgi:hypothetical protein